MEPEGLDGVRAQGRGANAAVASEGRSSNKNRCALSLSLSLLHVSKICALQCHPDFACEHDARAPARFVCMRGVREGRTRSIQDSRGAHEGLASNPLLAELEQGIALEAKHSKHWKHWKRWKHLEALDASIALEA